MIRKHLRTPVISTSSTEPCNIAMLRHICEGFKPSLPTLYMLLTAHFFWTNEVWGQEPKKTRKALQDLRIFHHSNLTGRTRGTIPANATFSVIAKHNQKVKGCAAGALEVEGQGFVCAKNSVVVSSQPPTLLPKLIAEQHSNPKEWPQEVWEKAHFVPGIYASIPKGKKAYVYRDFTSWEQNEKPIKHRKGGRYFHFVEALKSTKGWALQQENGQIIPMQEMEIFSISPFSGRELKQQPLPEGFTAAFIQNRQGALVFKTPQKNATTVTKLMYQQAINAKATADPDWYIIHTIDGIHKGYIHLTDIRYWSPAPRPKMVKANEIWIDAHLTQQMLALYKGDALQFVTLMSAAKSGRITPQGIFSIHKKIAARKLVSRPKAKERYYIEKVPWVMRFYPMYAIHSAYWHNHFGEPYSHGCLNLSLIDAKYIFDRVEPRLYPGWSMAKHHRKLAPGTTIRIRDKQHQVRDRRRQSR